MVKALVTDFGRVLLFAVDENYSGLLNDLHDTLVSEGDYDFWSYFKLNEDLLSFYKELSGEMDMYVFTTGHIQEYPPVAERMVEVFQGVISAARLGVDKKTPDAYIEMAKQIGHAPEEIIFVDDTPEKIAAAKQAGMICVFYESSSQAIEDVRSAISSTPSLGTDQ